MTPLLVLFLTLAILPGPPQDVAEAIGLYDRGKFQDARGMLSELVRQSPGDADPLVWLGKACLKLQRWNDAVEALEKAARLRPQDGTVHLWLGRAYGHKAAHASIFSAFSLAGKTRSEFETAARLSPDDPEIRFDLLQYYLEAPGIVGGGRDKAQAQAREISRVSPLLGYTARAEIFQDAKEWEKARAELEQAVQKFPDSAGARLDLAQFLLLRRDFAGAAANAQSALDRDGLNRAAQLCRASARVRLGDRLPEALAALQALAGGPLTDHDPSFEDVYYWLGQAYLAVGKTAEARRSFETALGFNPEHTESKQALQKIKAAP